MKNYQFYKNSTNKIIIVKVGWSWPAFCFTWIWGLIKELWMISISFLSIIFLLVIIISSTSTNTPLLLTFIKILSVLIFGANGNDWIKNNLIKTGYKLIERKSFKNYQDAKKYITELSDEGYNSNNDETFQKPSEILIKEESLDILFSEADSDRLKELLNNIITKRDQYNISEFYLNKLAYKFMKNKNYDASTEVLKSLITLFPDSSNGYASLADVYFITKDYKLADKYYKIALEKIIIDKTRDLEFKKILLMDIKSKINEIKEAIDR